MAKVKGTLPFGEEHTVFRDGNGPIDDGRTYLPSYSATSPRLWATPRIAPGPSITEHMRFRSDFDKDRPDGPFLCVSEIPHNLDQYLIRQDLGPKKPVGFYSKDSLERTMRRILEADRKGPVKRKPSANTYTFSKSERM